MKSSYKIITNFFSRIILFLTLLLSGFTVILSIAGIFFHSKSNLILNLILIAGVFLFLVIFFIFSKLIGLLNKKTFIILLLFFSLFLRFTWIIVAENIQTSDFAIYHELACSMINGTGYALTGPVGQEDLDLYLGKDKKLPYTTAHRAPGTSFAIAFIYKIFGINPVFYKILNVFMGTLTCFLIYSIVSSLKFEISARMASAMWCFYPSSIFASNLLCSEILFTFLLLVFIFCIQKFIGSSGRTLPLISCMAGIVSGCIILTRPMLMLIAGALVGWGILTRVEFKKALCNGLILIFFLMVIVSPWMYRNYKVFGKAIMVCTMVGDFLARQTAIHIIGKVKTTPEWERRWKEWKQQTNEVDMHQVGYSLALYNIKFSIKKGIGNCFLMLTRGVYRLFGHDNEIAYLSTTCSQYFAVKKERLFSIFTRGVLNVLNWSYYLTILILCFLSFPVKYRLFNCSMNKERSIENYSISFMLFFEIYFMLAMIAHILTPTLNRYHFSLLTYVVISAGLLCNFRSEST